MEVSGGTLFLAILITSATISAESEELCTVPPLLVEIDCAGDAGDTGMNRFAAYDTHTHIFSLYFPRMSHFRQQNFLYPIIKRVNIAHNVIVGLRLI